MKPSIIVQPVDNDSSNQSVKNITPLSNSSKVKTHRSCRIFKIVNDYMIKKEKK